VFSPDGRTLYTASFDGSVIAWNVSGARRLGQPFRFTRQPGGVAARSDVDFSPDGKLLASAKLDGTVTVWDIGKQRPAFDLPGAIAAFAVRFSPDGKLVAVGDSSGNVVFWDAASSQRVADPLAGAGGSVSSIDFDPAGGTLATASEDGSIRLWDVTTRKLIGAPLPGSTSGGSVSFFPDGKRLLGVFSSGTGIVWNVDAAAWKTKACTVASRNLTRGEWTELVGGRSYENVCP
jgi:WD40 repeat protein